VCGLNANLVDLGDGAGDVVNASMDGATVTLGDGTGDVVTTTNFAVNAFNSTITLGNGNNDLVNLDRPGESPGIRAGGCTITLGNGNNDTVIASQCVGSTITVGNGDDTIYVARNDTVTVGTGHDSFIFPQTGPDFLGRPAIGAVTITGFDPNKDSFTFSNQLTTSVSYHDNAQGNAVVTVDNSGDTITLVGVHASELHPGNFHFVDDPAAVPAIATTAQMVADLHAHNIL